MYNNHSELLSTALSINIKKYLTVQRKNLWQYALNEAQKVEPNFEQIAEIQEIFVLNNVDASVFCSQLIDFLTCSEIKINGFRIIGAPNSGKTLIANCITAPFITCHLNNHGSENEFYLSNLLNKSIGLCEELFITPATCEDFKSILGGQPIDVAKKFNEKQLLQRTPIVVTSNYDLFGRGYLTSTDEHALSLRCFNFKFNTKISPSTTIEWQQFYHFMLNLC